MIKNVVFDIGNVLAGFVWEEFYAGFGFSKEINEKLAAATVYAPIWKELDRGVLTDEELLERFIENDPSIEKEIRRIYQNIQGMLRKYDYAIPWLRELKSRGYGVYYISNFGHKPHMECGDAIGFLEEMLGGILSYQVKLVKPEPEIYRLFLQKYNLNAGECVFIDDTEKNVEAAKKEGMKGIIFHTREQAAAELEQLFRAP